MKLVLLLCLMLLSPQVTTRRHHPREMKKKGREPSGRAAAASSPKEFTFDLYRTLASAAPGQNIFFSPVSVTTSLTMLCLGARAHTKAQILEGLGIRHHQRSEDQLHEGFQRLLWELSQPRDGFQLTLGNALFTDPAIAIQDTFLKALKTWYLADAFPVSFGDPMAAMKQINDYVAKQTNGKIVDLIQNLDSTHFLVMVNYIFFKAKWETGFSIKNTQEQDFYVTPETTVRVAMMNREDQFDYFLDQNLACKVVGVPYQGNATALFVLPNPGKMEQLENGLNGNTLKKWLRMFTKRELRLYLPRFSIEGSYQLEKILPRLGISDVFSSHADLSGITDYPNTQVSEMVHKAKVEVDEAGTQAAAAAGMIFTFRSAQLSPPRIMFDRPFLILIQESKNILFLGKVVRPVKRGWTAFKKEAHLMLQGRNPRFLLPSKVQSTMSGPSYNGHFAFSIDCPCQHFLSWRVELFTDINSRQGSLRKTQHSRWMIVSALDSGSGQVTPRMKQISLVLVLGLLVAVLCHPDGTLDGESPVQDEGTQVQMLNTVASSNDKFAFHLYKLLVSKSPGKNVIFSPTSIFINLAFLGLGARGTTLAEILEGLQFNLTETPVADIHQGFQHLLQLLRQPGDQLQLRVGNAMFIQEQQEVLAAFLEDARALYSAQVITTNFQQPAAAEKLINDFIRNETQGKIVDLVRNLDPQTAMILVNYIFFKAKWKKPFDPHETFKSKFYLSKSQSVQVPMMMAEDLTVPYFRDEELSCTVVELKYTGNATALFILPDQGKMQEVEAKLLPETLGRWRENLKPRDIDELYLPKFSISGSYKLENILSQLGIREAFSRHANLSGITTRHQLQVSQVMHNALLDVAEAGTEAAAATGSKIILTSAKLYPVILKLNRPFLMNIFNEGTILFMGKITNPKQAKSS
ncbi:uncharacterized protein RHO17_016833 [Thomomys bottae]